MAAAAAGGSWTNVTSEELRRFFYVQAVTPENKYVLLCIY